MQMRDNMIHLFEQLGDCENITREMLINHADLIVSFSKTCHGKTVFLDSKAKVELLYHEIEANSAIEDKLLHSWHLAIQQMLDAPTHLHLEAAIILYLPLVSYFLPQATGFPQELKHQE
ncbi:hypothetical protein D3C79_35960 [compost metagenome]